LSKESKRHFFIESVEQGDRLDCQYYDPEYFETLEKLKKMAEGSGFEVNDLADLLASEDGNLTGGATPLGAVYLAEGIPFIRIQNIKETGIDLSDVVFISRKIHNKDLVRSQLRPEDVLMTITGTYGVSAVVPEAFGEANINQHVVRIAVDRTRIDSHYLSMYLNSAYAQKQMQREVTGNTRLALDYAAIKTLKIVRPDKGIQRSIVEKVKEVYARAKHIQTEFEKLEDSYDSTILSKLGIQLPPEPKLKVFLTSVADRLEVKWYYPYYEQIEKVISDKKAKRLREFSPRLQYGASIDADYFGDIPFLRIENLRRNYLDTTDLQDIPSKLYEDTVSNLYLEEGDLLIARSGVTVGTCAYVPHGMDDYVHGSYIIKIRLPKNSELLPRYLSVYINSVLGRLQIDRLKTGSAQPNINTQQIREILIIQPETEIQEDIVSAVYSSIEEAKALRIKYADKISEARNLFISLLSVGQQVAYTNSERRKSPDES
jgi:restriction endonuclease S subunit